VPLAQPKDARAMLADVLGPTALVSRLQLILSHHLCEMQVVVQHLNLVFMFTKVLLSFA
jgi:hypothetical protein